MTTHIEYIKEVARTIKTTADSEKPLVVNQLPDKPWYKPGPAVRTYSKTIMYGDNYGTTTLTPVEINEIELEEAIEKISEPPPRRQSIYISTPEHTETSHKRAQNKNSNNKRKYKRVSLKMEPQEQPNSLPNLGEEFDINELLRFNEIPRTPKGDSYSDSETLSITAPSLGISDYPASVPEKRDPPTKYVNLENIPRKRHLSTKRIYKVDREAISFITDEMELDIEQEMKKDEENTEQAIEKINKIAEAANNFLDEMTKF